MQEVKQVYVGLHYTTVGLPKYTVQEEVHTSQITVEFVFYSKRNDRHDLKRTLSLPSCVLYHCM